MPNLKTGLTKHIFCNQMLFAGSFISQYYFSAKYTYKAKGFLDIKCRYFCLVLNNQGEFYIYNFS